MKRLKLFIVGLLAVLSLAFLGYRIGLLERYNFITAYWDIWNGEERVVIHTTLADRHDELRAELAPKFGFECEINQGCVTTDPYDVGLKHYNKVMGRKINARLGGDWFDILNKEIEKLSNEKIQRR